MKTLFIGQNAIHLKAVGSTNSYASELLHTIKPPEGTVIYTFEQQNGRGQRGNTWESEPNKNGAFSFILHPTFLQAEQQFLLTKMVSLAVADLMAELLGASDKTREIKIKWPNDIYVDNKKIAGILIENTLRDKSIQHSIIGIGLNINQIIFNSYLNATSLALLTNKEFELTSILEKLCEHIEARYLQLKTNKPEALHTAYLKNLYQLNEWKTYRSNNEQFNAKIVGVNSNGKLQLELTSGKTTDFDLKEIQFM
jgi:BirA family biotin operon repressor/biotin-[acetyl-CoA-carboxylase] ligase